LSDAQEEYCLKEIIENWIIEEICDRKEEIEIRRLLRSF
jgi:hypothetical protein